MFFFTLAPTLDAALAFVAGGAAGILLTRVAQLQPAAPPLLFAPFEHLGTREELARQPLSWDS